MLLCELSKVLIYRVLPMDIEEISFAIFIPDSKTSFHLRFLRHYYFSLIKTLSLSLAGGCA